MLIVETKAKIRRLHEREQKPIREIARELKLARNTVRRAVREELFGAPCYVRQTQPGPKLGEFVTRLTGWLEQGSHLPKRQRRTARRLYEDLCQEGYTGAYDSVQRYVKRWKGRKSPLAQVFIPLAFAPGEAYQFDFSEEEVEIAGAVLRVKVAQFKLCYSGMAFAVAYPCERLEMVLDAHNRAFSFFGGSSTRGIYDNLKTCVAEVLRGKERRFNPRFLALMGHYLVEPVACTPAAGWEKGQVENLVGNLREWLFVPRPKFDSWAALNTWLAARCLHIARQRLHSKAQGRTVWELFEEERAVLTTVSVPFDGYVEHERRVSSTALVNFDRNHYSVDASYAGRPVTLRAYAERVVIVAEGQTVGEHVRLLERSQVAYNPWHYLQVLERKPGALRNGAPFQDWDLPGPIVCLRDGLLKKPGGDRQFVEILCAAQQHSLEAVAVACELALEQQTLSSAAVLNLLHRLQPNPPRVEVSTPERLRLNTPPKADLGRYDRLLTQAREVRHAAP